MKKHRSNKKQLKEAISAGAISPLGYSVLVDASNVLENKRGLIKSMFPSTNSAIIKKWFSKISLNDKYGESKEKLMALGSRFSDMVALKVLYKSLNALKSTPLPEAEKEQREKDIQKIIDKIGLFIRKRLTDGDAELIEKFVNVINNVANNIAGEIDSELKLSVQSPEEEKPKAEPKEEPKKEPVKPIEAPKVEGKVNERLKNKIQPTNENFPGPGEIVGAKDLDYDMLSYFNRMNKKLSIDTKTKKGINGSVAKMYGNFVFNGDTIDKKDILQVKILESNVNERLKNKLRKKIKEIIRTQMLTPKLTKETPLHDIAALIRKDWKNVYFGAKPYLDAMSKLTNISDRYGADDAKTIVLYFLSNASAWRGDTAKAVKAHLKSLVK